jgi:hypothetical protein
MVTECCAVLLQGYHDEAASSASFLFSISDFLEVNVQPDHATYHIMLTDPSTGLIDIIPGVSALKIDSLECFRTGDQIPSDGIVVEGLSQQITKKLRKYSSRS